MIIKFWLGLTLLLTFVVCFVHFIYNNEVVIKQYTTLDENTGNNITKYREVLTLGYLIPIGAVSLFIGALIFGLGCVDVYYDGWNRLIH